MTNYPRETADRFESAARSGQDFSDVYSSIVGMQQSSRDFNSYTMQMLATNMMLQQRGLADFDGDGNQDFILGAKNGLIYTADPTHQVVQARDKNFQVINEMELPMPPLDFESRGRTNCFPNVGERLRREREREEWLKDRREKRGGDCRDESSCCPPQCCCCACGERSPLKIYRGEGADTERSPLSDIYDNGAIDDGTADESVLRDQNMLRYPPFEGGAQDFRFSTDEGVTDYSQFTGDGLTQTGELSTDGTLPADGTLPTEGTMPADGTMPTESSYSNEGSVPAEGAYSTEGALPSDGTVESSESTDGIGLPPAFAPQSGGKP